MVGSLQNQTREGNANTYYYPNVSYIRMKHPEFQLKVMYTFTFFNLGVKGWLC